MDIGGMRHPVEIRQFEQAQDPVTGEITEEWATLANVWARIDSVDGREFMAASAEQAKTTHKISMYYRCDMKPSMRLQSAGIEYQVKALLPNNDHSQLTVMCEVLT